MARVKISSSHFSLLLFPHISLEFLSVDFFQLYFVCTLAWWIIITRQQKNTHTHTQKHFPRNTSCVCDICVMYLIFLHSVSICNKWYHTSDHILIKLQERTHLGDELRHIWNFIYRPKKKQSIFENLRCNFNCKMKQMTLHLVHISSQI